MSTLFGLYCRLWLQSKYDTTAALLDTIRSTSETWLLHERLGRVIGAFVPVFEDSQEWPEYFQMLSNSPKPRRKEPYKFHRNLASDPAVFRSMFDALSTPNTSRGTGITHAKFLLLLTALRNPTAPAAQVETLRTRNSAAWCDVYYRQIARRIRENRCSSGGSQFSEGQGG